MKFKLSTGGSFQILLTFPCASRAIREGAKGNPNEEKIVALSALFLSEMSPVLLS